MSQELDLQKGDSLRVVGDTFVEFTDLSGNIATLHVKEGEELRITMVEKKSIAIVKP